MLPQISNSTARADSLQHESLSPAPESTPLERIRTALVQVGLNEQGVERMSIENIRKLVPILERGEKHSALVIKIFNAVTESNPGRLEKLVNILSTYEGNFSILGQFLERVGHMDPFVATSRAQLLILPAEGLPTTRGASGHILHGLTYCAYDCHAPTDTIGYFSKKQAITRIFEAFNPERMTSASQGKVRERRSAKLREALQDLTLQDLEQNPDLAKQTGSHLIVRNMEVYAELRKAIADCKAHLSDLVYGGSVLLSGIRSIKVSEDPGRQFYGWFEEHFKENPNAPRGIRLAYESLRDPDVALSPEDERNYMRGLLSYQRLHSYINKDVALGGLMKDLKEYEQLGLEDPLRLDEALDSARRDLQRHAADSSTEMTVSEFGRVIELAGMVKFRQAMNERVLAIYGDEFAKALTHFDFVSFKDGKWREDAVGDSVPMERLKQHLYGAKIGTAQPGMADEKKQALLGQRDFKHISEAQFLERLMPDLSKRLNAMPITDFRDMVQGAVVAYRKAMHMEGQLAEYLKTPAGAAVSFNREKVEDAFAAWKPALLIGRYLPAEAMTPGKNPVTYPLPLQELALRLTERTFDLRLRGTLHEQFYKKGHEIRQAAPAGLFTSEMEEFWQRVQKVVEPLVPAENSREIMTRAVSLLANPLIRSCGFDREKVLSAKYLFPEEIAKINNFLTIEERVNELSEPYRAILGQLADRVENDLYQMVFTGGIAKEGYRRLTLGISRIPEMAEQVSVRNPGFVELRYYEPEKLLRTFSDLDNNYVTAASLGKEWIDTAVRICSKFGAADLAQHRLSLVDTPTFRAARELRDTSNYFISRDFAEAIKLIAGI